MAALEPALDDPRPLVLLDTFELMSATSIYLRDTLLPSLPAEGAVIIAGRGRRRTPAGSPAAGRP